MVQRRSLGGATGGDAGTFAARPNPATVPEFFTYLVVEPGAAVDGTLFQQVGGAWVQAARGVNYRPPALTTVRKIDAEHSHVRTGGAPNILDIAGLTASYTVTDRPIVVEFGAPSFRHSVGATASNVLVMLMLMDTAGNTLQYIKGVSLHADRPMPCGQNSVELNIPGTYNLKLATQTVTNGTLSVEASAGGPIFMRARYSDGVVA